MKIFQRSWRWLVWAGLSVMLGVLLYAALSSTTERVDAPAKNRELFYSFSHDGRFILSYDSWRYSTDRGGLFHGPCRRRDSATGKVLSEFAAGSREYDDRGVAIRKRYWAGLPHGEEAKL